MRSTIRNFPRWIRSRRSRIPLAVFLVLLLVLIEWRYRFDFSLGILYIFPVILSATILNRWQIVAASLFCAYMRGVFTPEETLVDHILRFFMAAAAYAGSGLFVVELTSSRRLLMRQYAKIKVEQALRLAAEKQLRLLVESSPAAIVTLDNAGRIIAANRAANEIFAADSTESLLSQPIQNYLMVLAQALTLSPAIPQIRTSATTWGHRRDGSIFPATTWFSIYGEGERRHLAAIIVDNSEEVRERERMNFQHLIDNNHLLAGAVSHEIRNLCSAIAVVSSSMERRMQLECDSDFQALKNLVSGLNKMASFDLRSRVKHPIEAVSLEKLCSQLGLIVESDWSDIGGAFECSVAPDFPFVKGDFHSLLQVLLNLAQNSLRAVSSTPEKRLSITVMEVEGRAIVRVTDTGIGIAAPEQLFHPFRKDATGTGLGLYISRALAQRFDGELRYVPTLQGCCFELILEIAHEAKSRYGTYDA